MTRSSGNTPAARTFTGRHMAIIMVGFFGVIIAVNVTMAVFASTSWTGLVVKNSYVASQNFNGEMEIARKQKARGWKSDISYFNGVLSVTVTDARNAAVLLDTVTSVAERPSHEGEDQTVALVHQGGGLYRGTLQLNPGLWNLRVTGGGHETLYRRDLRLIVRDGNGILQ